MARAALAGALDRAVDVAAALEVRGYALAGRPARGAGRWSRHDIARRPRPRWPSPRWRSRAASAGVGQFDAYPTLRSALGPGELALVPARSCVLGAAPFAGAAGAAGGGACLSRSLRAERLLLRLSRGRAAPALRDV